MVKSYLVTHSGLYFLVNHFLFLIEDGLVSEAEFIHVWMKDVGEPRDRSDIMFSLLDEDDDGFFGNDQEKLHFFDGVDYDGTYYSWTSSNCYYIHY